MNLKASVGTLQVLQGKSDLWMKTAYLLLDGRCVFDCSYCSHARSSKAPLHFLSRVVWREIEEDAIEKINSSQLFERVCLQVVSYPGYEKDLEVLIPKFAVPVSVSVRAKNLEEIERYFDLGAERVGLAIDVANPDLFGEIRGGRFESYLQLLEATSKNFPGRVTTHIIVGLGETDRDVVELVWRLKEMGVTVALFAFTPVKGTLLEHHPKPPLERYRRIQVVTYLIEHDLLARNEILYDEHGNITEPKWSDFLTEEAIRTRGCPACNRPFYNESPKGPLYNVHGR